MRQTGSLSAFDKTLARVHVYSEEAGGNALLHISQFPMSGHKYVTGYAVALYALAAWQLLPAPLAALWLAATALAALSA